MPMQNRNSVTVLIAWSVIFVCPAIGNDEIELLFAKQILPIFKEKCLGCHGSDPDDIKAELDMRTLETTVRGGESGEASLVPKDPLHSPLYLAVTRKSDDWSAMPPKENDRLSDEQVAWIRQWILSLSIRPRCIEARTNWPAKWR